MFRFKQRFSDVVGGFEQDVQWARGAFDQGRLGPAQHLVDASVEKLWVILGRLKELDVSKGLLTFDELPEVVRERIAWVQADGDVNKARAWYDSSEPIFHGMVPAEAFSEKQFRGQYLNDTCNYRVQEHLDAFLAVQRAPVHNHGLPSEWSAAGNFYISDCPACHYYCDLGHPNS